MIAYVDTAAAIDWLTDAFGFRERERISDEDLRRGVDAMMRLACQVAVS